MIEVLQGVSGPGGFLVLGFAIGLGHALEADHLAAVGTLLKGREGLRRMMARGAAWGAGHTLALFGVTLAVLTAGLTITGRTEALLELCVAVMIVALGLRVLWRLRRDRVHIHVHEHGEARHIHAHSHAEGARHDHAHKAALGVGMVHGLAGSAGLLVLTAAATQTLGQALGYVAVFGLGSIAGMATLTAALSLPLGLVERGGTWMKTATTLAIGLLAVGVGGSLAIESAWAL